MDRETTPAGPSGDRPKTKPFSIRLTKDEKTLLLRRAGNLSLGAYVRGLILAKDEHVSRPRQRRSKTPIKDHEGLARVLAALGQSRIANNLNQLAKAVNSGVLPVTPETEDDLREACSAVRTMRVDLMHALGLTEGSRS